ncbi:pituitary homeobox 2-like [Pararge aegeria]|uniref:pituitary homeobox 2-like n=1 Tax=Pararge aegeria TaxID=116150 RepID=UPI0019CFD4A9|nr:pituitary homeobox 2-like [Pararge aegeria]
MKYMLFKQLKSEKNLKISQEATQMAAKESQNDIVKSKYVQNCISKKSKRFRSAFTTEQINYLEQEYKKFPYIGSGNRKEVSNKLNIPERAVKIWFQNRRMKEKKECGNKEVEVKDLTKDSTKFINEPLNKACNWQSINNDHRCSLIEQAKRNEINFSMKPFAPITTAANGMRPSDLRLRSSYKPTVIPTEIAGVSTKKFNNTPFSTMKNLINADVIMPEAFQKVKNTPNVTPIAISKPRKVCTTSSKNKNKGRTSYCPLANSYLNINQDMPQDLSSRSMKNKLHSKKPHYPVNSISGFMPMHLQNSYSSSALTTGNVIWKPVNMLSTLPVPQPSSVSIGIPQNSARVHVVNNHVSNTCSCSCNCHGSSIRGFGQVNARAHPQYILAIPFSNPPK